MSERLDREILKLGMRSSLSHFTQRVFQTVVPGARYEDNWHIDAMSWALQECLTGGITRLIVTVPPRHLKSVCASVAFPAWALGQNPKLRFMFVSHSADLASAHSRDCRRTMESRFYRELFPGTRISAEKNTEMEFWTTAQGYRFATSVGGSVTGRGGDIIVLDDPLKADDAMSDAKRSFVNEYVGRTLYSRLDDKRSGVIILIMQRLHIDDLVGYLLQQDKWVHLNLPVLSDLPQRIPIGRGRYYDRAPGEVLHVARDTPEVLAEARLISGSYDYSAQWLQSPIPIEGEIIKWSWFRFIDEVPRRLPGDRVFQSWDTASSDGKTSNYSVCTTWLVRRGDYYLIDLVRERMLYPDLRKRVEDYALQWGAVPIIEDKASGTALIQDLKRSCPIKPIAFRPEGDKLTRMHAQSAKIEAGHVHLLTGADWLDEFRAELLQFPRGRYDDQVDSLSQFLAWIEQRTAHSTSVMSLDAVFRKMRENANRRRPY